MLFEKKQKQNNTYTVPLPMHHSWRMNFTDTVTYTKLTKSRTTIIWKSNWKYFIRSSEFTMHRKIAKQNNYSSLGQWSYCHYFMAHYNSSPKNMSPVWIICCTNAYTSIRFVILFWCIMGIFWLSCLGYLVYCSQTLLNY